MAATQAYYPVHTSVSFCVLRKFERLTCPLKRCSLHLPESVSAISSFNPDGNRKKMTATQTHQHLHSPVSLCV